MFLMMVLNGMWQGRNTMNDTRSVERKYQMIDTEDFVQSLILRLDALKFDGKHDVEHLEDILTDALVDLNETGKTQYTVLKSDDLAEIKRAIANSQECVENALMMLEKNNRLIDSRNALNNVTEKLTGALHGFSVNGKGTTCKIPMSYEECMMSYLKSDEVDE